MHMNLKKKYNDIADDVKKILNKQSVTTNEVNMTNITVTRNYKS